MAILNVVATGKFSSDNAIAEYGCNIWGIEPSWEALPKPQVGGSDFEDVIKTPNCCYFSGSSIVGKNGHFECG